jgi:tRNA A-37 threonylcarbamoyl transferase component Bud32
MNHCPSPEQLGRLLAEELPAAEREAVAAHVESCRACQETLEGLTALSARAFDPPPPSACPGDGARAAATVDCPRPGAGLRFLDRLLTVAPAADPAGPTSADTRTEERAAASGTWPSLPGYEILGELGRGGMGVVYKARQTKLNRVVALKMILAGGHAGAADLSRFQTEAQAIARLQHANIVQVYEVGEHEGKPFFSLEYCGGGSLEKKLTGTPLPAREAAQLIETLARAMQVAHDHHIIHRDLKPANVLLTEDGTPKITDFGLAKNLDEAGQTHSGAIMGTPSYMAPEQAGGKGKEIGPATDVYALGAILYECLTGRPPFKAATALDTILQVAGDEPVPPSQLQSKTPRDLETICLKCLHKEPEKRYSSSQALAEELQRFLNGEPILARPPALLERAVKWVRRRPAVAGLLAVLLIVGVGAFVGMTALWFRADRQWQRAEALRHEAANQRHDAELARDDARRAQKTAEDVLAESRQRLALNYLAYGQTCATASRLANAPNRQDAETARREFDRLAQWLSVVGDPAVQVAVQSFSEELSQWTTGPPPPKLQQQSLQLAHACRDSWLNTIEKELPTLAETIRRQLYNRACRAANLLAQAPSWESSQPAQQEFWQLYWGELAIVESKEVAGAMVGIGHVLQQWHRGEPPPAELKQRVEDLRKVCAPATPPPRDKDD